jgi:hypothetical protein
MARLRGTDEEKPVKEQLTFTGDDTTMANRCCRSWARSRIERALIKERQSDGIALAKQRGAYRGRKRSLTAKQVAQLRHRAAQGVAKTTLARELGISRETVYQYCAAHPLAY